ncbi:MAG: AMP-binding protein [Labilithrix sp.]|nr:AMP-binding protein [Labilithrix sp.]
MNAFPETIPALLAWRAAAAGSRPWLFYESDSWTLADVAALVDRYATGLADRGVGPGDRVAMILGNHPDTIFTWLATSQLGAIAAPLNPAFKAPEIAALRELVGPRVVVAEPSFAIEGAIAPADLAAAGSGAPRARVSPDDVAVLLATSGTTGAPKAVAQTHRTYALTAEAFPAWLGLDERDRLLAALPLFHVNAQAYATMGALGAGASLALLAKFSASRFWEDAKRLGATQFNAVGAIVKILLAAPARDADRDHAIRKCYAALALPEAEHRAFEERFGLSMIVGYGMSETTFGTIWPRDRPARYGTMGVLRQHPRLGEINRARVVRDDGSDASDDETGELWLANPATMRGYWNAPAETAAVREGAWLKTGDLVRRDRDGHFTFVARKKEVIRRRGENVAAAEIEVVLASHPSVREAAALGVPSSLGEEEIVAFVSPRPGATIDVEALRAWTRERLADFKVPSVIHVRAELPRTATERIAKHLLRKEL